MIELQHHTALSRVLSLQDFVELEHRHHGDLLWDHGEPFIASFGQHVLTNPPYDALVTPGSRISELGQPDRITERGPEVRLCRGGAAQILPILAPEIADAGRPALAHVP